MNSLEVTMADQVKEFLDLPRDFLKDGTQFINRCTKRMSSRFSYLHARAVD